MNNEEKAYRKLMPNPDIESMAHDHGRGTAAIYGSLDAEYFAERKRRRIEYVMSRLTMKQHELFALIICGMSRSQIAAELGISQSTLSTRERRLMAVCRRLLAYAPVRSRNTRKPGREPNRCAICKESAAPCP